MPGKGRKCAFRAARRRNPRLRPVEAQGCNLSGTETVHGPHHVEKETPPRPCIFRNGREDVAEPQATDGERLHRFLCGGLCGCRPIARCRSSRRRGWAQVCPRYYRCPARHCRRWLHLLRNRRIGVPLRPTHPDINAEPPEPRMFRTALRHRPTSLARERPSGGKALCLPSRRQARALVEALPRATARQSSAREGPWREGILPSLAPKGACPRRGAPSHHRPASPARAWTLGGKAFCLPARRQARFFVEARRVLARVGSIKGLRFNRCG